MCQTFSTGCNEGCPCVVDVMTKVTRGSAATKSLLMSHVTDRTDLETSVAAREESYSPLCSLAQSQPENRLLAFMATNSWRAELTPQANAAFQNNGLALDFMARHGMPHVGMHIDQEFDTPVSVAIVSHDGRAMVDCDCAPSLAFDPSFITAHARPSI